jgi:predicted dehydrogenase
MKKVQLGLIGLGHIGQVHLINSLKMNQAEIVAASDVSRKALNFAGKMGVRKLFPDYKELLKEKSLDAIIIALPTHLHAACAKQVAEAGKDIYLEKPLARNVPEGKEIISSARAHGVKLMVGYPLRFSPPFQALRSKIQSGELGEVQIAMANYINAGPFFHRGSAIPRPVPEWWFKKELTGGGALLDLGCHMINLLRWYFGEVSDVKSYLVHRFNLEQEDHAICTLKFKQGQISIVNVGWFSQKAQLKVELMGKVEHAVATYETPSKIRTAYQLIIKRTNDYFIFIRNPLQHFVHCVAEDSQPSTSGDDALKDLETIAQAYKSQVSLD